MIFQNTLTFGLVSWLFWFKFIKLGLNINKHRCLKILGGFLNMIILQKFSFDLKKTQSFFLKKKTAIEEEFGNKGSSGGGGNGKNRNSKFFFNDDNNFIYFGKIFVFSQKNNTETPFYNTGSSSSILNNIYNEEIILKNCENVPGFILCTIYEDLFYQKSFKENFTRKIKKYINNWYLNQNYLFSGVQKIEILIIGGKFSYIFQVIEPKIKSFKVYSVKDEKNKIFSYVKNIKTKLLSCILKVSSGKIFKLDLGAWNGIKISDGVDKINFSIKDQNLGDFGNFFDITLKIEKKGSLSFEPEISLTDNQLSSSINLTEKNLLDSGISVKQRIYFKKLNPHYIKFEIEDRKLRNIGNFLIFGKYLKNFFSLGFIFKKCPKDTKTCFLKISSGSQFQILGINKKNPLSFNSIESSLVISFAKFIKSHSCFVYWSEKIVPKFFKQTHLIVLNSLSKPLFSQNKLNGLMFMFENRYIMERSGENLFYFNHDKNLHNFFWKKKNLEITFEKYIGINSIVSKNIKIFCCLKFKNKGLFLFNKIKKMEMRFEIGKLFSFSWSFSNSGKTRYFIN